jgi:pSer/pThr/pTyr-binding forkhead associated (FHA) protein
MTIRCSQGHENADTATFCDECGEPLPTQANAITLEEAPTLPAEAAIPQPAPDEAPTLVAPDQSAATDTEVTQVASDAAATQIASAPPAEVPEPVAVTPSAPPPAPVALQPHLVLETSGTSFDLVGKASVVLGREDIPSNSFPDIDLTPYGAEEGGVSRLHARLAQVGDTWTIEDLESTNFTFVNRKRVQPKTPTPLNDGDEIRLGRVGLRFKTTA